MIAFSAIAMAVGIIVPPVPVVGPVPIDPRCAYTSPAMIPRDASGAILRSSAVRAQFMRANPCPSTGLRFGACAGWSVDHVIPLAVGGIDSPVNMQWMPNEVKTCPAAAGTTCKDRFERRIYRCWQP